MSADPTKQNPYQSLQVPVEAPAAKEMYLDESTLAFAATELSVAKRWILLSSLACFGIVLCSLVHVLLLIRDIESSNIIIEALSGIFYVLCGILMLQCAGAISSFLKQTTSNQFSRVFQADARYWKAAGIFIMLMFGLIVGLAIVIAFMGFEDMPG